MVGKGIGGRFRPLYSGSTGEHIGGHRESGVRAVLMFHGVDATGSPLSVSAGELASLVHAIRASGHSIVPLRDLLDESRSRTRCVAFTFDDGALSAAEVGAKVLDELGVKATFFLVTGHVGRDNGWRSRLANPVRWPLMTWGHAERLVAGGHAIEAHSVTHPDLRTLPDDALEKEVVGPVEEIRRRLGVIPRVFSYPYGFHDRRIVDRVRRSYRYGVTTRFRFVGRREDPLRIPRVDAAYLRSARVREWFGDGVAFRAYIAGHWLVRGLRRHP